MMIDLTILSDFFFFHYYVHRKLKRLNLGGNELTSVPQRALSIFDNLKKLEIQENKIRVIKEGDFEGKHNFFVIVVVVHFKFFTFIYSPLIRILNGFVP